MTVTRKQKESYLESYREQLVDTLKEFTDSLTEEHINKMENLIEKRREFIENAFKNGINVGTLIDCIVYPFDIVYVENSDRIANGYYYITEENGKEKLYSIRVNN